MFLLKKIKGNYLLFGKEKPKDGDLVYNVEKDEVCNFVDLSEVGIGQGAFFKIIASANPLKVKHYPGVESNGEPIAMLKAYKLEILLREDSLKREDNFKRICFDMSKDRKKHPILNDTFSDLEQFIEKLKEAKTAWLVELELDNKKIPMESPIDINDFFVPKITEGYINITKIIKHPLLK